MADGRQLVDAVRRVREQRGEASRVLVERERVQAGEQLTRPVGVQIRLQLELAQQLEVVPGGPRGGVEAGQLAAAQRELHARSLATLPVAEEVVGGELELQVDRLAAA